MVYNNVSIDRVIGKILRDTRLNDLSYTADMPEWIAEALKMAMGTRQYQFKTGTAKSCFHKAKLPCTMMSLDAVSYGNKRLRYRDIEGLALPTAPQDSNIWQSVIDVETGPPEPMKYWGTIEKMDVDHSGLWYSLEPGYLVTSFPEGTVNIWYRAMPHDERGLPMIPDNVYLHNAIYWYVRMKLIGTGWLDPVYKLDDRIPEQRYNDNHDRATSSMDFATPDMVGGMNDINLRFYPPQGYWETLGNFVSPDNVL